jgi:hypothetical protein
MVHKKITNQKEINLLLILILILTNVFSITFAQIAPTNNQNVNSINTQTSQKVADGETLNISVHLTNFGNNKRIDVKVKYSILNNNQEEIYTTNDTVAVETTASFIKKVQILQGTAPGTYTAKTSIIYPGQIAPAESQFSFIVERKIFGIFQNDFLIGGLIIIFIIIVSIFIGKKLIKERRKNRFEIIDYSNISRDKRIYYEIISDTIMQMRNRVGDDAFNIALDIDGLILDEESGKVISISEKPSKIIATLVSKYEELLGQKVSFSLKREINKS